MNTEPKHSNENIFQDEVSPEDLGGYLRKIPENFPAFKELFQNPSYPLEVEIGCGKGKFIVSRAEILRDRNFLALDYARKWMNIGIQRSDKRQLQNLRFVHTNALRLLEDYLPKESVSVFHIYFPDPWPKRRHRKRRLVNADFFKLLHQKLVSGGLIEAATDQSDYFEEMITEAKESGISWARSRRSVNERLFCPEFKTNYELKYGAEGRPLYYAEFQK